MASISFVYEEKIKATFCNIQLLHAGGVWINLGPLLYHYSDIPGENSIEPCYDMVKVSKIIQLENLSFGFC